MDTSDEYELERLRKDKRKEEKKNNLREVAQICNCIGELLSKYGRYEEAISEHEAERALSEVLDDSIGEAVACRKLGECYCFLAHFQTALQLQQRHLSLARACDNTLEEQRALATIGRTYLCQSEAEGSALHDALHKAELAFLEATDVCERLKTGLENEEYQEMKARLFLNLGLVHDAKGDVKQSSEYMKRAISIAEKYHLWSDLYRCQFSLACMYQRSANYSSTLRFLEGAHKSTKKLKDKLLEAECLTQKSQVLIQIGDFLGAKHTLKKAYKLGAVTPGTQERILHFFKAASKMEEKSRDLASSDLDIQLKAFEAMGDAAAELTNYKQAIAYYLNMLKCANDLNVENKGLIPIYVSLAQTYLDDKQPALAVDYFIKEAQCRPEDYEQVCRTWLNIADAQEQQGLGYEKISKSFLTALEHAKKSKDRKLEVRVLKSLIETQKLFKQEKHRSQTESQLARLHHKYGVPSDDDLTDDDLSDDDVTRLSDDDGYRSIAELTPSDDSDEETGNTRPIKGVCLKRRTQTNFKRNEKGETPLHRACIAGNLTQVKKLLDQGHPVNPRDYCGWLPLHEASNFDFSDIVEVLLDHGASIDDCGGEGCGGITPLMDAGSSGSLSVMEVLLQRGADLCAKDEEGHTALDCLQAWYDRVEETLNREIKVHYQHIVQLLSHTQKGASHIKGEKSGRLKVAAVSSQAVSGRVVSGRAATTVDSDHGTGCSPLPQVTCHQHAATYSASHSVRKDVEHRGQLEDEDSADSNIHPHSQGRTPGHDTATAMYKDAIKSVGSSAVWPSQRTSVSTKPQTAQIGSLLTQNKIIGDDWLIDDVKSTTKRKRIDVDGLFFADRIRKVDSELKPKKQKSSDSNVIQSDTRDEESVERCHIEDCDSEPEAVLDEHYADYITGLSHVERVAASDSESSVSDLQFSSISKQSRSIKKQVIKNRKHKQLKLTSFGTAQKRNVLNNETVPSMSGMSFPNESIVPNETDVVCVGQSHSATLTCMMRLQVKVMGKIFLIPVPKSDEVKTVSWLQQEASQRYYSQFGRQPLVMLSTKDGAVLSPDDVISMVLSNNEELVAHVDSWDVPALQERYSQACSALRAVCYRNISTLLDVCDTSGCLGLRNVALSLSQLQPVLRALQEQTRLTHLDLQGNRLSDVGMESLCKSLATMPNLTHLNLACSGITNFGLKQFADLLQDNEAGNQSAPMQSLSCLDVSGNLLGDAAADSLVQILSRRPRLTSLAVASCRLTVELFSQHRTAWSQALSASKLSCLDVSYNRFGSLGVELLLKCLNGGTLTTLNLCGIHTGCNLSHLSPHLQQYISQPGCHLEELNLSGNYLSLDDASFISRMPLLLKKLKRLNLSANEKVENGTIQELLEQSARQDCCLECVTAVGCGVRSPLDPTFLASLSDKLSSDCALSSLTFTCDGLDHLDTDSLTHIWLDRWKDAAEVHFSGNLVQLLVLDKGRCEKG